MILLLRIRIGTYCATYTALTRNQQTEFCPLASTFCYNLDFRRIVAIDTTPNQNNLNSLLVFNTFYLILSQLFYGCVCQLFNKRELSCVEPIFNSLVYRKTCSRK